MSKNEKKLLNENTIRRFMKLAEIDKLSDQFVGTLSERNEGNAYVRDDDEEGAEASFDVPAGEEELTDDGTEDTEALPDEPPAPETGGDAEAVFTDVFQTIADVAREKYNIDANVEAGEEAPETPEVDVEPDAGALDDDDEEETLPGVELEEDESDESDIVDEIMHRVTARLMKESRQDSMADQLAERIMKRLKGSTRRRE